MTVEKDWLDFLREQYPKGSGIRLSEQRDALSPVQPGTKGTLEHIDDEGQFHVSWEDGKETVLAIGKDRFQVLPPEPQTLKFYMPLTATYRIYDSWGDPSDQGEELDGRDLRRYESSIRGALLENQRPEEAARGLMYWYNKQDGVEEKVQSEVFEVEDRDGQLWGVAECKVIGELLPEEKESRA